jgi:hypothetical protein
MRVPDPMGSDKNIKPGPGMGLSSERTGHVGPRQQPATHGVSPSGIVEQPPNADEPPEQRPGQVEENPEGIPPKAGYPERDPRHDADA